MSWSPVSSLYQGDLDQEYSHDLFGGHTNEEMQPHFYRNVIERTDELRWMPIIPFRYYMLGFRDFVMAGNFDDLQGSDVASCFLGLVEEKLEKQHEFILPIIPHSASVGTRILLILWVFVSLSAHNGEQRPIRFDCRRRAATSKRALRRSEFPRRGPQVMPRLANRSNRSLVRERLIGS
jgi:hypothetical protein